MRIIDSINKMNPRVKSLLFIFILIIIGIFIGYVIASATSPYLIGQIEHPRHPPIWENNLMKDNISPNESRFDMVNLTSNEKDWIINGFMFSTIILSVEIVLLIGLIGIYINIYTKTKSKYLVGFLLFVIIFLVKSISQIIAMTPLFYESIRAAPNAITPLIRGNFGPFGIFFAIFEIIAICVLIYISSE